MKKIFSTIMTLALAAFVFTSCEDVPAPYNLPGEGGSEEGGATEIVPTGTGTLADPYNIAGVLEATANLETGANMPEKVAFTGVVTTLKECSKQYGNATFYLGDEENSSKTFYVYRCLGINNKNVTADDLVQEGDEVTVYGTITNYNGTIETAQKDAYIVKIVRNGEVVASSDGAGDAVAGEPKGTGTEADPFNVAAAIKKCQETGETETSVEYYVKGLASTVDESGLAQYGNINIDMVDNGSDAVFKAFQIYSFNGKKFTASSGIKAGDEVVVKGKLVNYKNNTPETVGKGAACLVSVNGKGGDGSTPDPTPGDVKGSGTQADPYNVAAIIKLASSLAADAKSEEVYFKGKVSTVTEISTQYGNGTFYISDNGTTANQFYVFRCKDEGNKNFTDVNAVKVGDEVVICGKVTNYKGNTPETVQNEAYIYSNDHKGAGGTSGGSDTSNGFTFSAQGYTNAQDFNDVAINYDSYTTMTFSKGTGSTTPKYYNTGTAMRMYGSNTLTIKSSKAIKDITITYGEDYNGTTYYAKSDNSKVSTGTYNYANQVWTLGANEGVLTYTGQGGHLRFVKIVINYADSSSKRFVVRRK